MCRNYSLTQAYVGVMFQIQHVLQRDRRHGLTPMVQLLIALRFYATGTFQLVVGDTFCIHKSTVCRVVQRVTAAIAALRAMYVIFPASGPERRDLMNAFYTLSGLPGCIAALDCTQVPIQSPGGNDAEIFRNRKGYFSINVQLISDHTGYAMDVVARWLGSVHDATIFDNSQVRATLETQPLDGYLVCDSGYLCRRYMLTPVANPATEPQKRYNAAHITARNCIERANGILKRRFPALKYGLRLSLDHTLPVIVAAVVLNNIAFMVGDELPPDDGELSNYVQQLRTDGLAVDYDPVEVGPPPCTAAGHATAGVRQAVIDSHFV